MCDKEAFLTDLPRLDENSNLLPLSFTILAKARKKLESLIFRPVQAFGVLGLVFLVGNSVWVLLGASLFLRRSFAL